MFYLIVICFDGQIFTYCHQHMQYIVLKSVKSAVNICANIIVMCTSVRQNAVALFMSMLCFLDESLRSCYGRNLLLCCRHSVTVVQFV